MPLLARSTKAGILSRRHPRNPAAPWRGRRPLNEGRDIIPATPPTRARLARFSCRRSTKAGILSRRHHTPMPINTTSTNSAQRRPGYYPGDTGINVSTLWRHVCSLNEGRDIIPATPPWSNGTSTTPSTLNEGRDIIPATPLPSGYFSASAVIAQRRPGYYPGDTPAPDREAAYCTHAQRRPGYYPGDTWWRCRQGGPCQRTLNEGRDIIPATPPILPETSEIRRSDTN